MELLFEPMSELHRNDVIDIFNYYIENSLAAYSDTKLPYAFYDRFMELTNGYPAYVMKMDDKTVGFTYLRAYHPFSTFQETAEITYFISKEYTGKGLGKAALAKIEEEARKMGIKTILANIASENQQSLDFHKRNGFRECGRFEKIIHKHGKRFDIVWMQKWIA
jgi:phosphinothricin acetyltransferase